MPLWQAFAILGMPRRTARHTQDPYPHSHMLPLAMLAAALIVAAVLPPHATFAVRIWR